MPQMSESESSAASAPLTLTDFTPEAMSCLLKQIDERYKYTAASYSKARQSDEVKAMGQKEKGRIDAAKERLDAAYKQLRKRMTELIENYVSPADVPQGPA